MSERRTIDLGFGDFLALAFIVFLLTAIVGELAGIRNELIALTVTIRASAPHTP